MEKIIGQAVHKRNVSNKVVFVDVIKTEDKSRISVLFKKAENSCDQSVIDRLKRGKEKMRLGDVVEIHGSLDQDVFVATQYKIITRWSISNPNKSFESQPPTMKKSVKVIFLSFKNLIHGYLLYLMPIYILTIILNNLTSDVKLGVIF